MKFLVKMFSLIFVLLNFFFLCPLSAKGEASISDLIITWSTNTFLNLGYEGRKIPIPNSDIYLYILAKDASNKIIDLENYLVAWYVDSEFLSGGVGKIKNQFKAEKAPGDYYLVTVEVFSPLNSSLIASKSINIPIGFPEVVINVPYYSFQSSLENLITALPYYFNVSSIDELNFNWEIKTNYETRKVKNEKSLFLNLNEDFKNKYLEITVEAIKNNYPLERIKNKTKIYVE